MPSFNLTKMSDKNKFTIVLGLFCTVLMGLCVLGYVLDKPYAERDKVYVPSDELIFVYSAKSDLCFAYSTVYSGPPSKSFTNVPCTPEVMSLATLEKWK